MNSWTSVAGRTAAALTLLAAALHSARAQRPAGADTMSKRAVADSLAVLQRIDVQLKTDNNNAALWYRKGMIAWALYDRDRASTGLSDVDWTRIGRMADSSLRLARAIEPTNPRYVLSAGQFFLGTGLATMRVQSSGMFGDALTLARAGTDAAALSEAALEVGRVYWRKYDAVANAGYATQDAAEVRSLAQSLSQDTANHTRGMDPERTSKTRPYSRRTVSTARRTLDKTGDRPTAGFAGESDYLKAEKYMREAYAALPSYPRAYQQLAMLLSERSRWAELESLARTQVAAPLSEGDPWTWMTLGLASYRQGAVEEARKEFERGLGLMRAPQRERLDHLERVLRPRDTVDAPTWSADDREAEGRKYWAAVDPLWSITDIDARAEFLARIAFAELRWSVEELGKHGTDSDRGIVYVRYGPADRIASNDAAIDWTYDYYRLHFKFNSAPSYGTAHFADFGRVHDLMDSLPAIWDNTHLLQIDTVEFQIARFRAAHDSVDVLLASRPPVAGIQRGSDVAAPIRSHTWLVDPDNTILSHDSTRLAPQPTTSVARRRLAFGEYGLRLEASSPASLVAGRSFAKLVADDDDNTGFPATGFGMSDFVLATSVTEAPARRWTDAQFAPLAGPLTKNAPLALVWENYDFGNQGGNAVYRVAVTIVRERSRAGQIKAQVIGAFGRAAGRDASLDRLQMRFDRTMPHGPVVVDHINLGMQGTPPGTYMITVAVTDQVSGKSTSRSARVVIGDQ